MDIISSLPDPILCHILSFLQTKFSVRTSVVARRWRFLWTSVPNLRFEEEAYYGSEPENIMGFSDMVYRVLLFHHGSIDSLIIRPCVNTDISQYQIDAWISTAIERNLQVLSLSNLSFSLPQHRFKSKTLVELTLERCTISAEPGAVWLPNLKKLNLYSNYYEYDKSLPNLVSGCLTIESLCIERDMDECEMFCCHVCSPTLKSLVLTGSVMCYESDHEHELVLDTPALQYLRMDDSISYIIRAEKLSSLVVADIWLSNDFLSEDEENRSHWRDNTFQFLEKLSNAKTLTFRSSALVKTFSIATTRFHNLTQLKLEADWHVLTELLESAYKLEQLTIEKVENKLKWWREPKHVPKCLLSSVKYVNIFGFTGEEHEFNMVRYIMKHANVLTRIKIRPVSLASDSRLNMLQRISSFTRGSKKCRLTFL